MGIVLLYLGAALTAIWGISHLMPTKNVVAGFGNISDDNRHIITMEWIVEGVSLIFIGVLVAAVTFVALIAYAELTGQRVVIEPFEVPTQLRDSGFTSRTIIRTTARGV